MRRLTLWGVRSAKWPEGRSTVGDEAEESNRQGEAWMKAISIPEFDGVALRKGIEAAFPGTSSMEQQVVPFKADPSPDPSLSQAQQSESDVKSHREAAQRGLARIPSPVIKTIARRMFL